MPFYEYRCEQHGKFDKRQEMSDQHTAVCPECGGDTVMLFSPFKFRIAVPLTVYQAQPHGEEPTKVDWVADSSDSADRNPDIPPDYPNLIV